MHVSFLPFQIIKDEKLLKGKLYLRSYCLSKVDRIRYRIWMWLINSLISFMLGFLIVLKSYVGLKHSLEYTCSECILYLLN